MDGKRGRPTYNTLIARQLLQRHVPAHLREESPVAPKAEEPEATTKGLNALRNVTRILAGKAPKLDPVATGIPTREAVYRHAQLLERLGRC